jgi:hypothetical protein
MSVAGIKLTIRANERFAHELFRVLTFE